jgi:hypothetical protein
MAAHNSEADKISFSSLHSSIYVRPSLKRSFSILNFKQNVNKMIIQTQRVKVGLCQHAMVRSQVVNKGMDVEHS